MKHRKRDSLIMIALLALTMFYACSDEDKAAAYVQNLNNSDTFLTDIAYTKFPDLDSSLAQNKRQLESYLQLNSLESGYDSIQIRVHWGCGMGKEYLLVLKHDKHTWTSEIGTVRTFGDFNEKYDFIIDSVIWDREFKIPKSGWRKFIERLFELQILSIVDNEKIPGFHYDRPNDGCGVGFQIATRNTYRVYSYDNPDMYDTVYWEAKNVLSILRLINNEFGIKEARIQDMWPLPEDYKPEIDTTPIKKTEIFLEEIPPDSTMMKKKKKQ